MISHIETSSRGSLLETFTNNQNVTNVGNSRESSLEAFIDNQASRNNKKEYINIHRGVHLKINPQ